MGKTGLSCNSRGRGLCASPAFSPLITDGEFSAHALDAALKVTSEIHKSLFLRCLVFYQRTQLLKCHRRSKIQQGVPFLQGLCTCAAFKGKKGKAAQSGGSESGRRAALNDCHFVKLIFVQTEITLKNSSRVLAYFFAHIRRLIQPISKKNTLLNPYKYIFIYENEQHSKHSWVSLG